MLRILTRKLCPLMSLAIVTFGCGKKIEEPKTGPAGQTHHQEMSPIYVLSLDGSESVRNNYYLPRSAQFEIPGRINIRQGSAAGTKVEIAFDVNEFDNDDFHFKCSYVPSPPQVTYMILATCEDYDGNQFDIDQQIIPQRKGSLLQIRFAGSSSDDLIVDAIFGMNWI